MFEGKECRQYRSGVRRMKVGNRCYSIAEVYNHNFLFVFLLHHMIIMRPGSGGKGWGG